MLKIIRQITDLNFAMLMDVYEEGNRENAALNYPKMDRNAALLLQEQDFYAYLRDCFFVTDGAFYAILIKDGIYVSALRMEPYEDGYLLEALETAPQYRGNGYAKELIRNTLPHFDCPIYSHVHKQNLQSFKTHYACGFTEILDYAIYIDGSKVDHSVTLCKRN